MLDGLHSANAVVAVEATNSRDREFRHARLTGRSLDSNTTGGQNTVLGANADVSTGALSNATAIGYGAIVNASNKIRLGNSSVTVLESQVGRDSIPLTPKTF